MRDPFVVSSISWREVPLETAIDNVVSIEGLLKANLQLSEYGDIAGVAFNYVIEQPEQYLKNPHVFHICFKMISLYL